MGFVDYIFNIVRSFSDLINILGYVFLWFCLVLLAFYINNKEDYDILIDKIISIWFENNLMLIGYLFSQTPPKQWVLRSYEMGRFNFLFTSGRLPYFLLITKCYALTVENTYKKITSKINDFFFKKK